jgi:phytoene dehydrogenase-like protein/ferredoxin-NADP reductase
MKDYDAVVIGGGLGGLSAAAHLSVKGKKVLLLEKHCVPGGYASSFNRGRFEFDASLHELSGVGHEGRRGPLWDHLEECDVANRVEFLEIPEFYRSIFPDFDITIPGDREGFEEVLCEHFPREAEGIKRFSSIMFDIYKELQKLRTEGGEAAARDPSAFSNLIGYSSKTLADVLDTEVMDEKARAVITQLWGYYGLPPSKLSFLLFAIATATYLAHGPVHIKGKSQALSQAFVESIEDHGGEVLLNNGASRIMLSQGKVKGVVAEDGTEIDTDFVVCNANPITTCIDLIGREHIPSWYLKRLGWGKIATSIFSVFLGLDCTASDLGLDTHEIAVNLGYDIEEQYKDFRNRLDIEQQGVGVAPYNVLDPDFSPPGTSVVALALLSYGDLWLELSPSEYLEAKNRWANQAIDIAEKAAPGLRDHIEVVEVATPLTHQRFSGNIWGTIYGFENSVQESTMQRLPNRGPLEGLYFANAWMRVGGGYQPCIDSGRQAAKDVMEDMESGGMTAASIQELEGFCNNQAAQAPEIDIEPHHYEKAMAGMHPNRIPLKVSEIIEETESAKTLRMVAEEGELPYFRAGQYVNIFAEVDGVLTSRPYSISSAPEEPHYDLTVRSKEKGFFSSYLLDAVKPGDVLESTGPSGSFYHEPLMDTDDLVFLAGGSGITPFVSIIREVAEKGLPLRIHLLYGSRDAADIIFGEELTRLESEHANIEVDFIISEPGEDWGGLCGFIDAETISSVLGSVEGKTFYICGPAQMYPFCEGALAALGVPGRRVRKEAYGPPDDITQEEGWPGVAPETEFEVTEERSGNSFKARAGEPLMNSMERAGLVVPAVCRSGECTYCRTRLLEGEVFAPERVYRRWIDIEYGYIHPCMSYPVSDLRIRV